MGIRVHKFLGYGLTDLKHEGTKIADERVNAGSWLVNWKPPPAADYIAWLEARGSRDGDGRHGNFMDLWWLRDEAGCEADLCRCVAWSPEFGLPDALALRPLAMENWQRTDDPIDYAHETWLRPESQENRVEVIPAGLYPWNGSYMDATTGCRLPAAVMSWVRLRNDTEPDQLQQDLLDMLARQLGFDGHAQALGRIVPFVPQEVRDIAEFAGLFTTPDVWRQLRPLLYTYWS